MQAIESLLHPRSSGCAYCDSPIGTRPASTTHIPSLCLKCSEQLNWIDPVRCETCGRGERCEDCRRRTITYFTASRSAVRYSESVKPWLARFKYRGDERLKLLFTDMLDRAFHQNFHHRMGGIGAQIDMISYVPVSPERLEERGFNQAQLLAEELGRRLGIPVEPLLLRTKHTGKQSFKRRSERVEDMEHAFIIHPDAGKRILTKWGFRPITILIIDDVYTTGSTLNQCAKVISIQLPANVYGLTWAR